MRSKLKQRICAVGLCTGLIAGSVNVAAASPFVPTMQSFSAAPLTLQIRSRHLERKLNGVYNCCWRKLRGQSLIGLYCGHTLLNYALANDIIAIVTSNGKKVCTYGNLTRRLH